MLQKKHNNVLDHIGWTPLVPIRQVNTNRNVQILAKLESFNPGGSVKDRPAFYMIEEAERTGELTSDKIILGGNERQHRDRVVSCGRGQGLPYLAGHVRSRER